MFFAFKLTHSCLLCFDFAGRLTIFKIWQTIESPLIGVHRLFCFPLFAEGVDLSPWAQISSIGDWAVDDGSGGDGMAKGQ